MANLTLAIDDQVLKRARIRAVQDGTSVNEVVRRHLEWFAGGVEAERAREEALKIAHGSKAEGGGRGWKREEIYEDRLEWPREPS